MEILHCLHTAILVNNIQKAKTFYEGILGLSPIPRSLNYPGVWYQIGDYQIHLMEEKGYHAVQINLEKWGRNPHLALAVVDLNQAIADLQAAGYPVQTSASGRRALFTQDPDGNVIEINQN